MFTYEFYVWPDTTRKDIPSDVFKLFNCLHTRICLDFSAADFARFRLNVEAFGITLREITRTPAVKPEIVT